MVVKPVKPLGNAPIGWLGGKTRLRPTIYSVMPKHQCYVEVFGGSCTVLFGKPKSRIEIINDVDDDLTNLMKVLSGTYFGKDYLNEFISYVRKMPASRSAFQEWQKWLAAKLKGDKSEYDSLNPAQRAFVFYYCTKKGFSSIAAGGFEASPLTGSRYNQLTDFSDFEERLVNVTIETLDFEVLIEKYNRLASDTFFFCDPPYWIANDTNYYRFVFTQDQHTKFKECCDQIDKNNNKFIITYDDVQEIIDLYKDYFVYRTDPIVYHAADERGERGLQKTELFITNYDIIEMKSQPSNDDCFDEEVKVSDKRIDIPGHIGLEQIG